MIDIFIRQRAPAKLNYDEHALRMHKHPTANGGGTWFACKSISRICNVMAVQCRRGGGGGVGIRDTYLSYLNDNNSSQDDNLFHLLMLRLASQRKAVQFTRIRLAKA